MAGLGKYFNSETYTGRANVAKATYASFALIYLFYRIKRSVKKPDEVESEPPPPTPPASGGACQCVPCQPICPPYCVPAPGMTPPQATVPHQEDPRSSLKDDPLFKQQQKKIPTECEDVECDRNEAGIGSNGKNNNNNNNKKSDEAR